MVRAPSFCLGSHHTLFCVCLRNCGLVGVNGRPALGVEAVADAVVEAMSFNSHLFPSVFFNSPPPLIPLCGWTPDTLSPPKPEVHRWPLLWDHMAARTWTDPAGAAGSCLSQTQVSLALLSSPEISGLLPVAHRARALVPVSPRPDAC